MRRVLMLALFLLVATQASAQKKLIRHPSVSLTWTASVSASVIGYNVYRSTTGTPPFTFLANLPAAAIGYRDASVVSGTTYYYAITTVGMDPPYVVTESLYSSQTVAVIP
jgi:fibronectin type 3 domain-containing protein